MTDPPPDSPPDPQPDNPTEKPEGEHLVVDGVLVGVIPKGTPPLLFVHEITYGQHVVPLELATIAILPDSEVEPNHRAGLMLGLRRDGPAGEREVDVAYVPYAVMLTCLAAVVHVMNAEDLLKHEVGGGNMVDLVARVAAETERRLKKYEV